MRIERTSNTFVFETSEVSMAGESEHLLTAYELKVSYSQSVRGPVCMVGYSRDHAFFWEKKKVWSRR